MKGVIEEDDRSFAAAFLRSTRYKGENSFRLQKKDSNIRASIRQGAAFVKALDLLEVFAEPLRILVIGGGVTGATVALAAKEKGAEVVLAECAPVLFPLQAGSSTRWLHPYEYDWPLDHFREDHYPHTRVDSRAAPSALCWQAGFAAEIASTWQYNVWGEAYHGKLDIRPRLMADFVKSATELILHQSLPLKEEEDWVVPVGQEFHLVVVCVGRREVEAKTTADYRGYRYWDTDPFDDPRCGTPTSTHPLRILISGGGDGALQEFLRLCFDPENLSCLGAKSIYDSILGSVLSKSKAVAGLLKSLKSTSLTKPFKPGNPRPATIIKRFVGWLTKEEIWPEVIAAIESLLNPELLQGNREITLASRRPASEGAFSLNMLLAELVIAVAQDADSRICGKIRRRIGLSLVDVYSNEHPCSGKKDLCHTFPHEVVFEKTSKRKKVCQPPETFDIIITRFGASVVADS